MSYCVNISQANHCNGASSRYEFFCFFVFFHCCITSTQNSARHVHSRYSLNICQMKEWIHSFHYWWTLRLTSIDHYYQKSFPKLWLVFLSTRVRVSLTCLPRYIITGVRCFVFSVFLDRSSLFSWMWHVKGVLTFFCKFLPQVNINFCFSLKYFNKHTKVLDYRAIIHSTIFPGKTVLFPQ